MINISLKMGMEVVDQVEEIISDKRDKEGNFIPQTLGTVFSRKFPKYNNTDDIQKFLANFISESDETFYSTLSLNDSMPNYKAFKIAKKYNDKTDEFRSWNKVEGLSIIFKKGNEMISLSTNAIRTTSTSQTNIIFDVYNVELLGSRKINPISYGYKKTPESFKLSATATNKSSELNGWAANDFFEEINKFSKGFKEVMKRNIEKTLFLNEWSQWANILAAFSSGANTSTIFGIEEAEFSSGETVSGYVVANDEWSKIERATNSFDRNVSILTSDGQDAWTKISVDEPVSSNDFFDQEVLFPLSSKIKSEEKHKKTYVSDISKHESKINDLESLLSEELKKHEKLRTSIASLDKEKEVIKTRKDKKTKKNIEYIEVISNPEFEKANSFIKTSQNEIRRLKEIILSEKASINQIAHKIDSISNNVNELRSKLNQKKGEVNDFLISTSESKIVPVNFEFVGRIQDIKFNLPSFKNIDDINISVSDIGSIKLSKRIIKAKRKLLSASYKNPFLLSSFLNIGKEALVPNKKIAINKPGWEFNEGQLKAIGKMDSNKSTFFLQGPPGTGKTTTISRFAEIQATNDKQVLMTSSTKAAITGFIESVEKMSADNPNVFSVLNIPFTKRNDELQFNVETLYARHIDKIFGQKTDVKVAKIGPALCEDLKELITEQDIKDVKSKKITNSFLSKSLGKRIKAVLRDIDALSVNSLEEVVTKLRENDDFISSEQQNEVDMALASGTLVYKEGLYSQVKPDKSTNRSLKSAVMAKINKFDRRNSPEIIGKKFNSLIISKGLINVIAQTNTSRLSLETLSGIKDLQVDFDIDTVIIDEVSKSITLEILRMASNAKRAVFAGDYRQLPPDNNYDAEAISNIYFENTKNWDKLKKSNIFVWQNGDKKPDMESTYDVFSKLKLTLDSIGEEKFREVTDKIGHERKSEIAKLYKDSLFKASMITAIKANKVNSNYEILKESRRFNDSILQVVNTFYDGSEKLVPFIGNKKIKDGKNIEFDVFGKTRKGREVYWVDTSVVNDTKLFADVIDKNARTDHGYLSYNFKTKGSALKNEFNAIVCGELVESLVNKGVEQKNIGIICLNSGQKNLLKEKIGDRYPGVVIETISWFQGREKDVIITDFVWTSHKKELSGKIIPRNTERTDFVSYERVNVGVSRARKLLINVGAYDSFIKKITGSYVYANGEEEQEYPYMVKMMDAIKSEGEVIKDEIK